MYLQYIGTLYLHRSKYKHKYYIKVKLHQLKPAHNIARKPGAGPYQRVQSLVATRQQLVKPPLPSICNVHYCTCTVYAEIKHYFSGSFMHRPSVCKLSVRQRVCDCISCQSVTCPSDTICPWLNLSNISVA